MVPAAIAWRTVAPAVIAMLAIGATTAGSATTRSGRSPSQQGAEARAQEDLGLFDSAARSLKVLRRQVPLDADLELALALNEARGGQLDSARTRLHGAVMTAALGDTLPLKRRGTYAYDRENLWTNGRFDGWHWYVARARAEVAAALGRWEEAMVAARQSVAARPQLGREWILLATCAANAGHLDEAEAAVWTALSLDPALPEAQHWAGLMEWRAGRRRDAEARFRTAFELDSLYRAPALALVRSRLPGKPTTWPRVALEGARAAALLTSTTLPKIEQQQDVDTMPVVQAQMQVALPETLQLRMPTAELTLPVLVNEAGRIVTNDLPWFDPGRVSDEVVGAILSSLPGWRFQPAMRHGAPVASWTAVRYNLKAQ